MKRSLPNHPALGALRAAACAGLCALLSTGSWALSEAGSSASSAGSAASNSIGASSTSLTTSSNSSSNDRKVAAGDYTVVSVAPADDAAHEPATFARLTLRPQRADAAKVVLRLPIQTVTQAGLAAGATVTIRERAYGLEFAAGAQRQAFFLVLDDDWYRELASTAVVL
jgi:hypothetical protein